MTVEELKAKLAEEKELERIAAEYAEQMEAFEELEIREQRVRF